MGMHYRSESSSSLTNEQVDENFRILSENKSVTGSVTLSGSLIPSDPGEFDLGSGESPFKSLYLSNSITIVSGGFSQSLIEDPKSLQPPPAFYPSFYFSESVAYPITQSEENPIFDPAFLYTYGYPFEAPVFAQDIETGALILGLNQMTSSWRPNDEPVDVPNQGYLLPSPYGFVNGNMANNQGGMGVYYDSIVVGNKWVDRSRMYATDGVDLTAPQDRYNQGWWNYDGQLQQSIMGKTPFVWDDTEPRLWHFSSTNTYFSTMDQPTDYQTWGTRATYFRLLKSGSAWYNTDLEPPTYGDNDILVRMWNENVTQWSYWFTLEHNENNIHYYTVSKSVDLDGSASYYQDSINPGRISLVNDYKGSKGSGNNAQTWDYNPADPFYSSSCLSLSLRTIAGPFVKNGDLSNSASVSMGYGPQDSPTSNTLKMFPPNFLLFTGSQTYSVMDYEDTGQYGKIGGWTKNAAFVYPNGANTPPATSQYNFNLVSRYTPTQTNAAAGLNAFPPYPAYGFHQVRAANPAGSCAWSWTGNKQGVQIMPIIPLTTAHYPTSASYFWYDTASISGNDLIFTKPNKKTFIISPLPTGSTSLYNGDGILPNDRTVDLDGYNLTFNASNGESFIIDSSPTSKIAITGLTTSSYSSLIGYNTTDGVLSSTNMLTEKPYFYSTGSTSNNSDVNPNRKLLLGEVYNYNSPDYLLFDNSVYTVKTAGKYYININGTLGQDDQMLSAGLGWWKISLQINGTTVAESTAKQSGVAEYYGGLDLMYVGDLSVEDEIQIISNTSNPTATSTISNTTYRFSAEYLGS